MFCSNEITRGEIYSVKSVADAYGRLTPIAVVPVKLVHVFSSEITRGEIHSVKSVAGAHAEGRIAPWRQADRNLLSGDFVSGFSHV